MIEKWDEVSTNSLLVTEASRFVVNRACGVHLKLEKKDIDDSGVKAFDKTKFDQYQYVFDITGGNPQLEKINYLTSE